MVECQVYHLIGHLTVSMLTVVHGRIPIFLHRFDARGSSTTSTPMLRVAR